MAWSTARRPNVAAPANSSRVAMTKRDAAIAVDMVTIPRYTSTMRLGLCRRSGGSATAMTQRATSTAEPTGSSAEDVLSSPAAAR